MDFLTATAAAKAAIIPAVTAGTLPQRPEKTIRSVLGLGYKVAWSGEKEAEAMAANFHRNEIKGRRDGAPVTFLTSAEDFIISATAKGHAGTPGIPIKSTTYNIRGAVSRIEKSGVKGAAAKAQRRESRAATKLTNDATTS